jgi:DNA-binding transcriptional regulator YiaG
MTTWKKPYDPVAPISAAQIRNIRELFGWTQQNLADRLGTYQHCVSDWERGVNKPARTMRVQLFKMLQYMDEIE